MRTLPLRGGWPRCSATGGGLGTRSWAKRWAVSSCSAGSSLALIMASSEVPVSSWLRVSSPTGCQAGQAHCFWRRCT